MAIAHGGVLRRGRVSEVGRAYLVTTVTHGRKPLFNDFEQARCIGRCLRDIERAQRAETLCYVVMPDHLHWLMVLGEAETLPGLVKSMKSYSARRIKAMHPHHGPVWQAGYHDHALRSEEDVRTIARYVVANPVRAGLVARVGEYPLWDACWL